MNKRKVLGQFYTPEKIAAFAVSQALRHCNQTAGKAIELSAGQGHLLSALEQLSEDYAQVAVDIDRDNAEILRQTFPNAEVLCDDGLGCLDQVKASSFSIGLGNPPFIKFRKLPVFSKKLLSEILGIKASFSKDCRAEVLFFAQYMRLLKQGGVLAIIMPDTIMSGYKLKPFRESVVSKYNLISISEIDGSAFSNTEAKTHILHIAKESPSTSKIPINKVNAKGEIVDSIHVHRFDLIHRMDFSFHKFKGGGSTHILKDSAIVSRGNLTHKELKSMNVDYIHSTNISTLDTHNNRANNSHLHNSVYAEKGDILICRVGTRCVGKALHYKGAKTLISDCIYKLSFEKQDIKQKFIDRYCSSQGEEHLRSISRGVCSRYLTKDDIYGLEF